jgi:acyl-CoA dehydrogenase
VRVHPQILNELAAAAQDDRKKAARDLWDIMTGDHLPNFMDNLRKVGEYATNNGAGSPVPDCDPGVRKYYEQINRLSASFNVAANVALVGIGGNLKFKEVLGSYLGDVMSSLYIVSAALEQFERDGRPEADRSMLEWGCEHYLEKAEEALYDFIPNFRDFVPDVLAGIDRQTTAAIKKLEEKGRSGKSVETMASRMKQVFAYLPDFLVRELFPEGRQVRKPLNSKAFRAADVLLSPCEGRDRLLEGMFMPKADDSNNVLHAFEDAFNKVAATREARALVGRAMRKGNVVSAEEAVEKGIITAAQAEGLSAALKAADRVIQVDDYPPEQFWRNGNGPAAPTPAR